MTRVWTVVLSVWAMLAIVAVLAWSHRPTVVATPPTGAHVTAIAPHATTSTSAVARP
jgi:cyanate permease